MPNSREIFISGDVLIPLSLEENSDPGSENHLAKKNLDIFENFNFLIGRISRPPIETAQK